MILEDKNKEISEIDLSVAPMPEFQGVQLKKAPQKALTTASGTTPNTGDAPTNALISNTITRLGEIETALKNLGLIR